MSQFQVYYGLSPQVFVDRMREQCQWQLLTQQQVVFAFLPDSRCDIGEHSCLFASPDGRCIGVLAGKLFNFAPLTKHLPKNLSPTQQLGGLLQDLYTQHGEAFALHLQGFFALVVQLDGQLFAIRDAIGERPVYILQSANNIVLADRMAPLMASPNCSRQLDSGGVSDFLSTGFSPFERNPVKGITKLMAGECARISSAGISRVQYHSFSEAEAELPEADCIEQVRLTLAAAVNKRIEVNTKTALLLSGGLDSSAVGALVGGEQLSAAYSLNFGPEYRNELEFSGLMAKYLNIPARVITVTPEMVKAKFLQTANILDEPIGDPLTVPNIIVAEAAAQEVQLVFNGEGGDPIFGGPKNLPIMAFEAYNLGESAFSRAEMYLRAYNKGHEHLPQLLTPDFQQLLKSSVTSAELLSTLLHDTRFKSYLHRLMHINLRLKGAAQILPKVLKASAASGLAVRSPLFDRTLAELAFSLPPAMKLKGSVEKYVLKQAVSNIVPEVIIARPKSGMLVPVHYWFNKELRAFAKEVLLGPQAKIRPLFDQKALADLIAFKGNGIKPYYGDRIWLLLSLELWMQAHHIAAG